MSSFVHKGTYWLVQSTIVPSINKVLYNPELLELILLSLPSRQDRRPEYYFFPLQRVNRMFKDLIT